ncbi:MAG TPA: DUF2306 domain-containing protein [Allosphingosinicella sp.]|nr:DUF2306 domain-containing protein [Allosphingosinicella sp.]
MRGSLIHDGIMWVHIAGGLIAILAGALAVAARKGRRVHASAGTVFAASMLVLGVTALILGPFREPTPESPLPGILVCYFVLTSWVAARRRDGATGRFEIAACAVALGGGALMVLGGLSGEATTPAGVGPVFAVAGIFLLAGLGDLIAVVRGTLRPAQRLARHLWRMCFAFFIATGSFFLGQQDVMPQAVRGSPILFVLAFAPFAVMAFWLVRLRFAKAIGRLVLRAAPPKPVMEAAE